MEVLVIDNHFALPVLLLVLLPFLLELSNIFRAITEHCFEVCLLRECERQILTASNKDSFAVILRPIHFGRQGCPGCRSLLYQWVAKVI